ncbi:Rho GTPase-activating protein [Trichinella pseudospiralis]
MLAVNGASASGSSPVMVQCFTSDESRAPFIRRIEKVKFGVPASEAFSHDIPATLLVLLLRVNKLGPLKKDIWRAPGNQAHVRKLIHIMQHGRLVNIDNFSVYTAASVIKKFLSKLSGGIFGVENEERLFESLEIQDTHKRREAVCRVLSSLSVPCQHLLVLLFGTFRLITDAADSSGTRMNPEVIGLSVAPSLFHTCIHDGQRARVEDVIRFRMASRVVTFVVEHFGFSNLFPRENYEFYARITGRTLRVEANWHFSFHYPSNLVESNTVDTVESTEGATPANFAPVVMVIRSSGVDRAYSQPDVATTSQSVESSHDYDCLRSLNLACNAVSLDELKELNQLAAVAKSPSYLEWVHERQTLRMQTRSEWFLSPMISTALLARRNSRNRSDLARRRSFRTHHFSFLVQRSLTSICYMNNEMLLSWLHKQYHGNGNLKFTIAISLVKTIVSLPMTGMHCMCLHVGCSFVAFGTMTIRASASQDF